MYNKKTAYVQPELTIYGNVEHLTQQGGTANVDVPLGTPNTGPGSVTGDPVPVS